MIAFFSQYYLSSTRITDSPLSFLLRGIKALEELRLANLSNVYQAEWNLC